MLLLNIPAEHIMTFFFVLFRVAAMLFSIPFLSSTNIPVFLKVGLTMAVSVLVVPRLGPGAVPAIGNPFQVIFGIACEIAIGLIIGFTIQVLFSGIQLAGQMAGFQMGLAIANVMDPTSSLQMPILAQFLNLFALILFLTLNVHHYFIRTMIDGFELIPLMGGQFSEDLFPLIMKLTANSFVIAVKIGAPVMVSLLLTSAALGLVARAVPQMQIFVISMPVKIVVGLVFLSLSLPFCASFLEKAFHQLGRTIHWMLKMFI
jgi:flagellar biosynthetic protein FliR